MLIGGAGLLLGSAVYSIVENADEGVEVAITKGLDRLLLTFILVELLGAVRATIREHKLIAEPFLIVGMIAVIKEIVVVLIDAKDKYGKGDQFDDAMTELGVLAALVVAFGITGFLQRRKEREPQE